MIDFEPVGDGERETLAVGVTVALGHHADVDGRVGSSRIRTVLGERVALFLDVIYSPSRPVEPSLKIPKVQGPCALHPDSGTGMRL